MAETNGNSNSTNEPNGADAAATAQPEGAVRPSINILAQYTKDLSFENPLVRKPSSQPSMEMRVDIDARQEDKEKNIHEVIMQIKATAKAEDKTLFVLELDYAGLFALNNFKPEQIELPLLVECPRLLFPYARQVISNVTIDGGFPPLLIDPIDFMSLYIKQRAEKQASGEPGAASATIETGSA